MNTKKSLNEELLTKLKEKMSTTLNLAQKVNFLEEYLLEVRSKNVVLRGSEIEKTTFHDVKQNDKTDFKSISQALGLMCLELMDAVGVDVMQITKDKVLYLSGKGSNTEIPL